VWRVSLAQRRRGAHGEHVSIRDAPRISAPAPAPARTATARIAAVAAAVPATVVGNDPIAARIGVDPAWIVKRTGIRSRHVLAGNERLVDLAATAGRRALKDAGVTAAELDLVLVATMTADELAPNAAPLVAHELGAVMAGAFDVGSACTGFLSGLSVAAAQIEAARAERVLLIGADAMTRITDPDDRQTAALFGDGAGAAVITADGGPGSGTIAPVALRADGGAGAGVIVVGRDERLIRMDGQETFRHAVSRMTQATLDALLLADLGLDDIDLFVYHQANARILRAVGERLGIAPERLLDCIGEYANTSAATLPIALSHACRAGRLGAGDRVLLAAFGAGFTWGGVVVEWGATT
jgi:3-oxoacyl-[acyl-carrier-protein] synthase-3